MSDFARQERAAICDTFDRVGPDAPTVDEGWAARDLAAHLVIRESRPDLAAGMFVPPLKDRLDTAMEEMAHGDWTALVEKIRTGPPALSPARFGPVDELMNKLELFIHHEDVLRAEPGTERRAIPHDYEQSLWRTVRGMSKLTFRSAPAGVVLVADDLGRHAVKGPTDLGTVVLKGRAGDLVLYASGRQRVADVEVTGPPEAVAAMASLELGMG